MVFEKNWKFLCCFIVWIWDFIKKFCKTMVFFLKKIEIFEIQNFNKFPSFTISFYFFSIFGIFFFNFTYPNLSKNYGIFCSVLLEGFDILPTICGKLQKVLFKKILICEMFLFFQNCAVYYLFFFNYFWHFIFNFVYQYL